MPPDPVDPKSLSDAELERAIEAADERERVHMREAAANYRAGEAEGWTPGRREAHDRFQAGEGNLLAEGKALRAERSERAHERIRQLARDPRNVEGPFTPPTPKDTPMPNPLTAGPTDYLAAASHVIERAVLNPRRQDELDQLIRSEEAPHGAARLIAATGSDLYASAFRKVIGDPDRAPYLLTDPERAALSEAVIAQRATAMSTGGSGGADGGFLLPAQLDPSIVLSNDGSINPLRRISRVETLIGKSKKFVTSDGVTAAYGAEGSDVTATNPTLAQPEVIAQRGTAYVELTYEMWDDWSGATSELARLFTDAKDNVEADLFLHGRGADYSEPDGLTAEGLVPSAGLPASVADYIAAQNELPARWQPGARWLMNLSMINAAGQLVAAADASNAPIIDAQGRLLRRPIEEASYANSEVVYGDFSQFIIGDRLGVSVEPIRVVYNKDTGVPSGKRALLMIWRSGCIVAVPDAFVLLGLGS